MSWRVTVKQLKEILQRYDNDAIVMVGTNSRDERDVLTHELDPDPSYGYRNLDGEVFTDDDLEEDESVARADRVLILWPMME